MELTLEFIIQTATGQAIEGAHPVSDVVFDSREVTSGSLFVALPGEQETDGHDYVGDAIQRGASAALIDRELDLPYPVLDLRDAGAQGIQQTPVLLRVENSLLVLQEAARRWVRFFPQVRIIGITGSVGKTTTKELTADVLSRRYETLRSSKSYNNEIGLPITVLRLRDHHERTVLEMSMYVPGEIEFLTKIAPPQVGVVTMIAPVHLERAGTMERIIAAKTELVKALPSAPEGIAILNRDDENVMGMAKHTQARIFTYGLTERADLWADRIEGLGLEGIRFWLHSGGKHRHIKLPLLGRHSVHTALRAAAVGLVEGLSWGEIADGLQASRSQLRLLAVEGPQGSIILDDTYNASPSSTIAALNLLNDLMKERRIAVLGDMLELGSYEEEGHSRVGIRAAAVADLLVTVGERGKIIAREALLAGMPSETVRPMDTAQDAIEFLLGETSQGDVILIKGSRAVGMERIVALLSRETE